MLLCHTSIKKALWKFFLKFVDHTPAYIAGDEHNSVIAGRRYN
jgi:hypothetical protein